MSQSETAQVCFRCSYATASLLNELASQHGGMRPLILSWLAAAGYADAAERDRARPDRRRRQPLPQTAGEAATAS